MKHTAIADEVIVDVDGILRWKKDPLSEEVERSLEKFRNAGGTLICITGAPLHHVPPPLFFLAKVIFVEMGGLRWEKGKTTLVKAEEVEVLRRLLGIKVEDGIQEIEEGTAIIEGPRKASLTLLFGPPPHYPFKATAEMEKVKGRIEFLLKTYRLSLHLIPGKGEGYQWLDITAVTKDEVVKNILSQENPRRLFYLGDGRSDLPAMEVEGVIPVGFPNCVPEIQDLAKEKGVFIPESAPKGGVVTFFSRLLEGEK